MIKVEELRLGNCLNNCGQIVFVMEIYKNNKVELGYFKDSIGFVRSIDDVGVNPILLTEDILLKFGFKKENGLMCYFLDDYSDIRIAYEVIGNFYRLYPYTYSIQYVHQLQNLYFALTGTELKINL